MKRTALMGVPTLALVMLVMYGSVSYMMASAVTRAERTDSNGVPSDYGLDYEDVSFTSRRGDITLRGWFIPGPDPTGPTVIFVHGLGGTRTSAGALLIASDLVEQGFNTLLFDLRGHGESDGDRVYGGYLEQFDVLGAFDYLVQARGIPPDKIGVWGNSMGAGTSALAAAEEPAIRALVLDSTYANVSELIAQETARKTLIPEWVATVLTPGASLAAMVFYRIDVYDMTPEQAVEELDYPILLIHGEEDTRIPWSHSERVWKAAAEGSVMWRVPGVGHVKAFAAHPTEYVERLASYFRRCLCEEDEC